ncbi:MAG TPA: hypothetical protein QF700_06605 [Prochlorococcus sp.]|nr:hypothetical protein [Prochlorococcus sp.]
MKDLVTTSDSVIGSLCREVDGIRHRCRSLLEAMAKCNDESLFCRLKREFQQLSNRRSVLLEAAKDMQSKGVEDKLSIAFLIEISSRPLAL